MPGAMTKKPRGNSCWWASARRSLFAMRSALPSRWSYPAGRHLHGEAEQLGIGLFVGAEDVFPDVAYWRLVRATSVNQMMVSAAST